MRKIRANGWLIALFAFTGSSLFPTPAVPAMPADITFPRGSSYAMAASKDPTGLPGTPRDISDPLLKRLVAAQSIPRGAASQAWRDVQGKKLDDASLGKAHDAAGLSYGSALTANAALLIGASIVPCMLPEKDLPQLILVANDRRNADDRKFLDLLAETAREAKAYVGIEGCGFGKLARFRGIEQSDKEPMAWGIDSSATMSLAWGQQMWSDGLLHGKGAQSGNQNEKKLVDDRVYQFVRAATAPSMKDAVALAIESKDFFPMQRAAMKKAQAIVKKLEADPGKAREAIFRAVLDDDELRSLFERQEAWILLASAMATEAHKKRFKDLKNAPSLERYLTAWQAVDVATSHKEVFDTMELAIDYRAIDVAMNIGVLYCAALKAQKPLYVVLDREHVIPVYERLLANGGKPIPFSFRVEEHHVKASEELSEQIFKGLRAATVLETETTPKK